MEMVRIWQKDTKVFLEKSPENFKSSLTLLAPEGQNPPKILWWEEPNFNGHEWQKEFECNVKDKVWIERWKDEVIIEFKVEYAHKDVLERGFTPEELKFLNVYRDKFLLLAIPKDSESETIEDLYIWDNSTKEKYLLPDDFTCKVEEFKVELEKLNLI